MKFKEIIHLLWLFGVISTFFKVINTFLGPTNFLFRCVINTDNRIFRVLLSSRTLDMKMNKRLSDFQKTPFKRYYSIIYICDLKLFVFFHNRQS